MPRKRTLLQMRLKAIETINMLGCRKEGELKKLTVEEIIRTSNVTMAELKEIIKLQDAVKQNKLFSYLSAVTEGDEWFERQKQRGE